MSCNVKTQLEYSFVIYILNGTYCGVEFFYLYLFFILFYNSLCYLIMDNTGQHIITFNLIYIYIYIYIRIIYLLIT